MYAYSPSNNMFYPVILIDDYKLSGTWPLDAVMVSQAVFEKFTAPPPQGKVRSPNSSGQPRWVDCQAPTEEQIISAQQSMKEYLISSAIAITSDWRVELSLGLISDADKEKLTEWMSYLKLVKAIDTSSSREIVWPTKPNN